jgi:hypothetical protein
MLSVVRRGRAVRSPRTMSVRAVISPCCPLWMSTDEGRKRAVAAEMAATGDVVIAPSGRPQPRQSPPGCRARGASRSTRSPHAVRGTADADRRPRITARAARARGTPARSGDGTRVAPRWRCSRRPARRAIARRLTAIFGIAAAPPCVDRRAVTLNAPRAGAGAAPAPRARAVHGARWSAAGLLLKGPVMPGVGGRAARPPRRCWLRDRAPLALARVARRLAAGARVPPQPGSRSRSGGIPNTALRVPRGVVGAAHHALVRPPAAVVVRARACSPAARCRGRSLTPWRAPGSRAARFAAAHVLVRAGVLLASRTRSSSPTSLPAFPASRGGPPSAGAREPRPRWAWRGAARARRGARGRSWPALQRAGAPHLGGGPRARAARPRHRGALRGLL